MKILHCCLANFYIDGYSYQENILPKMHKLQGHEVEILASTETIIDNKRLGYLMPSSYYTSDGISITRLPYKKLLPHFLMKKLRMYNGIQKYLENFRPDVIFLHDTQFLGAVDIARYLKENTKTIVFADGHADFVKHKGRNILLNWFSQKILHGIIYKWTTQKLNPFVEKFYGVLPLRVKFIEEIYSIPQEKIELLVMGADDTQFDLSKSNEVREKIRDKHNINKNDFLIVSGGKMDATKKIEVLMDSIVKYPYQKLNYWYLELQMIHLRRKLVFFPKLQISLILDGLTQLMCTNTSLRQT